MPEDKSAPSPRRPGGFTLVEILVCIAILAILAAILIPVFGNIQARANQAQCASNIRQIAYGYHMYAQDHNGIFPTFKSTGGGDVQNWRQQLYDYVVKPDTNSGHHNIWLCPSKENSTENWRDTASYGTNMNLSAKSFYSIENPSSIMAVIDCTLSQGHHAKSELSSRSQIEKWVHFRHQGSTNMAMLDGHVESVDKDEIDDRIIPAFNPSKK